MSIKNGLARFTQKAIEKAGTEVSYVVGNATKKSVEYTDKIDQISRGAVAIESGRALGSTA